jgi:hypothetical protein
VKRLTARRFEECEKERVKWPYLSDGENDVVADEPAEHVHEEEDEAVPGEEEVDGPGGGEAEQEALLQRLEPRGRRQLEAQLAPAHHALLPRGHRVVGVVLERRLVRQLHQPLLVEERLRQEVVLGDVVAERLKNKFHVNSQSGDSGGSGQQKNLYINPS